MSKSKCFPARRIRRSGHQRQGSPGKGSPAGRGTPAGKVAPAESTRPKSAAPSYRLTAPSKLPESSDAPLPKETFFITGMGPAICNNPLVAATPGRPGSPGNEGRKDHPTPSGSYRPYQEPPSPQVSGPPTTHLEDAT
eukprot:469628-Prorocentrum_minimum.AAC.1